MKKITIIIGLLLLTMPLIFAQTVKIAYLDTDRIMEESELTKEAQEIFAVERDGWELQLAEIESEIEKLQNEFEARKLTLTESGKKQAEERIQAKVTERRRFIESIFGEEGRAMQRNAELLEPIMIQLKDSIEKIANSENYSIIFDAVGGGILYAKPDLDITDLIIEDMNKKD